MTQQNPSYMISIKQNADVVDIKMYEMSKINYLALVEANSL